MTNGRRYFYKNNAVFLPSVIELNREPKANKYNKCAEIKLPCS